MSTAIGPDAPVNLAQFNSTDSDDNGTADNISEKLSPPPPPPKERLNEVLWQLKQQMRTAAILENASGD
jgi:hypothetical protein